MEATKDNVELLLKDLSERLAYDVICKTTEEYFDSNDNPIGTLTGKLKGIERNDDSYVVAEFRDLKDDGTFSAMFDDEGKIGFLPYLRKLSSMTKKEKWECIGFSRTKDIKGISDRLEFTITNPDFTDWLNEHHFDYRGLIEKGLAIEAPPYMYVSFGDKETEVTVEYKGKI